MLQHHDARQDDRRRVDHVQIGVFRRGAVRGLEDRRAVADVRARRHSESADLRRAGVRQVIAVQIRRGDDRIFIGSQQHLLEHRVGDAVVDQNFAFGHFAAMIFPQLLLGHYPVAEFLFGQLIPPVAERPFGVLHDVALVDERNDLAVMLDRVADRAPHQVLRARDRDRLYSDAGITVDLIAELAQKLDQLPGLLRAFLEFDARVNVLSVFAEDHDVELLRLLDGAGHAVEIAHRPHAGVKIEDLPQRHVERPDAAADGRGQRTFDRDDEVLYRVERALRQPFAEFVEGLFAREDFVPNDAAFAAISFLDRRVEDATGSFPDVAPRAVAFDEGDHRVVGNYQPSRFDLDGTALSGSFDSVENRHKDISPGL